MSTKSKRKDKQRYLSAHPEAVEVVIAKPNPAEPKPNPAEPTERGRASRPKPTPTITQAETLDAIALRLLLAADLNAAVLHSVVSLAEAHVHTNCMETVHGIVEPFAADVQRRAGLPVGEPLRVGLSVGAERRDGHEPRDPSDRDGCAVPDRRAG